MKLRNRINKSFWIEEKVNWKESVPFYIFLSLKNSVVGYGFISILGCNGLILKRVFLKIEQPDILNKNNHIAWGFYLHHRLKNSILLVFLCSIYHFALQTKFVAQSPKTQNFTQT
jgi:hypothetical protein